jgi:hypothetical protein
MADTALGDEPFAVTMNPGDTGQRSVRIFSSQLRFFSSLDRHGDDEF